MNRKNDPAWLMASQFSFDCEKKRQEIIKKAIDTCGESGMPIPNDRYYEALANGIYHGPSCDCYQCRWVNESAKRKFR